MEMKIIFMNFLKVKIILTILIAFTLWMNSSPVRLGGEAGAERLEPGGGAMRTFSSAGLSARAAVGEEPVRELRDGHHRPVSTKGKVNPSVTQTDRQAPAYFFNWFVLCVVVRQVNDLHWHAGCLQCSVCSASLRQSSSCYIKNKEIFCKLDYFRYWPSVLTLHVFFSLGPIEGRHDRFSQHSFLTLNCKRKKS